MTWNHMKPVWYKCRFDKLFHKHCCHIYYKYMIDAIWLMMIKIVCVWCEFFFLFKIYYNNIYNIFSNTTSGIFFHEYSCIKIITNHRSLKKLLSCFFYYYYIIKQVFLKDLHNIFEIYKFLISFFKYQLLWSCIELHNLLCILYNVLMCIENRIYCFIFNEINITIQHFFFT